MSKLLSHISMVLRVQTQNYICVCEFYVVFVTTSIDQNKTYFK